MSDEIRGSGTGEVEVMGPRVPVQGSTYVTVQLDLCSLALEWAVDRYAEADEITALSRLRARMLVGTSIDEFCDWLIGQLEDGLEMEVYGVKAVFSTDWDAIDWNVRAVERAWPQVVEVTTPIVWVAMQESRRTPGQMQLEFGENGQDTTQEDMK